MRLVVPVIRRTRMRRPPSSAPGGIRAKRVLFFLVVVLLLLAVPIVLWRGLDSPTEVSTVPAGHMGNAGIGKDERILDADLETPREVIDNSHSTQAVDKSDPGPRPEPGKHAVSESVRLSRALEAFQSEPTLGNAHPVLCLSIARLIARNGGGSMRDGSKLQPTPAHTKDGDPFVFLYNGNIYEFRGETYPAYSDWFAAMQRQEIPEAGMIDGPQSRSQERVTVGLEQAIVRLAEQARATY